MKQFCRSSILLYTKIKKHETTNGMPGQYLPIADGTRNPGK